MKLNHQGLTPTPEDYRLNRDAEEQVKNILKKFKIGGGKRRKNLKRRKVNLNVKDLKDLEEDNLQD